MCTDPVQLHWYKAGESFFLDFHIYFQSSLWDNQIIEQDIPFYLLLPIFIYLPEVN